MVHYQAVGLVPLVITVHQELLLLFLVMPAPTLTMFNKSLVKIVLVDTIALKVHQTILCILVPLVIIVQLVLNMLNNIHALRELTTT